MATPTGVLAESLAKSRAFLARMMDRSAPRVMLLTSSLGSGHMMAAQALTTALRAAGRPVEIETLDVWSLVDPEVATALQSAYLEMIVAEPELFDAVYRLGQRTWRSLFDADKSLPPQLETFFEHFSTRVDRAKGTAPELADGERHPSDRLLLRYLQASVARRRRNGPGTVFRPVLARWAWARVARRLEQRVADFGPHVAIATQMSPAVLLASIKQRRDLELPLIAVPTDFGIHDAWLQPGIGHYCVAHDSIACADLPTGSVLLATGIPLQPGFRHPPPQASARRTLGLHPERQVVLVAGGGLGLGVAKLAERLLAEVPEARIVAVSGRNREARDALAALQPRDPGRLVDCGWTERMPTWLSAADVVVGKPGGLTVAESLACGRYLLAINSPGGQESFNVRFLAEHGAGALVGEAELGERLRALLADPAQLLALHARAAAVGRRDGAACIAALALDLVHAARAARWNGGPT
ncbi:MAG TPA: glycosyltransferase [Gammaproteobacteria bacterium]|nr:glycosyltransferase [Gammaproteobacteria bacterium]